MDKTLFLDSSNELLIVGLGIDNKIVDEIIYPCFQRQSEFMIQEIKNILKTNNVHPKEIDSIVVTKGPGSYTGLRIALTIAKIYGTTLGIDVYSVSSLEILKDLDKPTICLMNARSKRSYVGIYNKDEVIENDKVMTNEEVLNFINEHKDYLIGGNVNYLNLDEEISKRRINSNYLLNMYKLKKEENKVKDILSLKALYLKD